MTSNPQVKHPIHKWKQCTLSQDIKNKTEILKHKLLRLNMHTKPKQCMLEGRTLRTTDRPQEERRQGICPVSGQSKDRR